MRNVDVSCPASITPELLASRRLQRRVEQHGRLCILIRDSSDGTSLAARTTSNAAFAVQSNLVLQRVAALINTIGNLGGYVGLQSVGWIKDSTKSFEWVLYFVAASAAVSTLISCFATRVTRAPYEALVANRK